MDYFFGIDQPFKNIIGKVAYRFSNMTKLSKGRVFHKISTVCSGKLTIINQTSYPKHDFFQAGNVYPILIRYANGVHDDDAGIDNRGATIRVLTPAFPIDYSQPLLDLLLTTGSCFLSATAASFSKWILGNDQQREQIVKQSPHIGKAAWNMYRTPEAYSALYYYSKVANCYSAINDERGYVRFRIVPLQKTPEGGFVTPSEEAALPAEVIPRQPDDNRPKDFLHQNLREKIRGGGVDYWLQIQYRPQVEDFWENDALLDCTREWPEEQFRWCDIGSIHLDNLLDCEKIDPLSFNPANAPENLAMPRATSPTECASLSHLRSIVYEISALTRNGQPLPEELRTLENNDIEIAEQTRHGRIAIIGGGPGGLFAARELKKRGYQVTVFEKEDHLGGKGHTITIDGYHYNVGAHVCTSKYEQLAKILDEYGIPRILDASPKIYDIDRGCLVNTSATYKEYFAEYRRYQTLRDNEFPQINKVGFYQAPSILYQPITEFIERYRLQHIKKGLGIVFTSSGYGYLDNKELPALYFVKLVEMLDVDRVMSLDWTIKGGFKVLWDRIAADIDKIQYSARVKSIVRNDEGVAITTNSGVEVFDKVVIACPLNKAVGFMDTTEQEEKLIGKIRYFDYYTTYARVKGIPRNGFHFLAQHCYNSYMIGYPVSFLHFYENQDIYAFYSLGNSALDQEDIVRLVEKSVKKMGGVVEEVFYTKKWSYLPHVAPDDLYAGFYKDMEARQGNNHTYFVGGLFNFELIEPVLQYVQHLVDKHFAAEEKPEFQRKQPIEPERAREIFSESNEIASETSDVAISQCLESLKQTQGISSRTTTITRYIQKLLAVELDLGDIPPEPESEFFSLGLDSVKASDIFQKVSDDLQVELEPSIFFDYPTIQEMAGYLAQTINC